MSLYNFLLQTKQTGLTICCQGHCEKCQNQIQSQQSKSDGEVNNELEFIYEMLMLCALCWDYSVS